MRKWTSARQERNLNLAMWWVGSIVLTWCLCVWYHDLRGLKETVIMDNHALAAKDSIISHSVYVPPGTKIPQIIVPQNGKFILRQAPPPETELGTVPRPTKIIHHSSNLQRRRYAITDPSDHRADFLNSVELEYLKSREYPADASLVMKQAPWNGLY